MPSPFTPLLPAHPAPARTSRAVTPARAPLRRLLRQVVGLLGLDEQRCARCLRPFRPDPGQENAFFCPDCAPLLAPPHSPFCPRCGLPSALPPDEALSAVPCGQCLTSPPPWQHLVFCGPYAGALRDLVLRFKFGGELALAGVLAGLLREQLRRQPSPLPVPDLVLPMPQHAAHLRRRGYNQAHELAAALCRMCALPLEGFLLYRTRPTPSQAGLNARQRQANVHKSFALRPCRLEGRRCWLVDDVMTTGSTAREACTALLDAGAAAVDLLVAARTPPHVAADAATPGSGTTSR